MSRVRMRDSVVELLHCNKSLEGIIVARAIFYIRYDEIVKGTLFFSCAQHNFTLERDFVKIAT